MPQSLLQTDRGAANGQEAVELTRKFLPDVILMYMSMPVLDGVEAIRPIPDSEARLGGPKDSSWGELQPFSAVWRLFS